VPTNAWVFSSPSSSVFSSANLLPKSLRLTKVLTFAPYSNDPLKSPAAARSAACSDSAPYGPVMQTAPHNQRGFWQKAVASISIAAIALPPSTFAQGRAQIPVGRADQIAALPGLSLKIATYKPEKCSGRILILNFHGIDRNAGTYRDSVRRLARRTCALVVAPEFDLQQFSKDEYQYGGAKVSGGRLVEPGTRSIDFVAPLVRWSENAAGLSGLPYLLLGHSAGGQYLSRVAAYTAISPMQIVIANPSTWVMPSTDIAVPFGFGGIRPPQDAEQALRSYLGKPIIVALGKNDTGDEGLENSIDGKLQGPYRYARGLKAFSLAKAAAATHGWPFNWTLVEVEGVGHDPVKMFNAPETLAALAAAGVHFDKD
jgi:hypothetical protein